MQRWMGSLIFVIGVCCWPIVANSRFIYTHPPVISKKDFPSPDVPGFKWIGPFIGAADVKCWHAEPSTPDEAVGGSDEWQTATGFIPIDGISPNSDYRQKRFDDFGGGGRDSLFKESDMPSGIFLSFKAHPVWQIERVEYPARGLVGFFNGQPRMGEGIRFTARFLAAKTMGECYFAGGAWVAVEPR